MASQVIRIFGAFIMAVGFTTGAAAVCDACDIETAIASHNAARDGDAEAVEMAIDCFESLEKTAPENPRVLAYLGSSYALKASFAKPVSDKMRFTNLGFDSLDYAVELAPDDFEVRAIRWNVNEAVPSMFGRGKYADEDLRKLDVIFRATPTPRMAISMVPAYAALAEREPDNAAWREWKARAETLAKEAR